MERLRARNNFLAALVKILDEGIEIRLFFCRLHPVANEDALGLCRPEHKAILVDSLFGNLQDKHAVLHKNCRLYRILQLHLETVSAPGHRLDNRTGTDSEYRRFLRTGKTNRNGIVLVDARNILHDDVVIGDNAELFQAGTDQDRHFLKLREQGRNGTAFGNRLVDLLLLFGHQLFSFASGLFSSLLFFGETLLFFESSLLRGLLFFKSTAFRFLLFSGQALLLFESGLLGSFLFFESLLGGKLLFFS